MLGVTIQVSGPLFSASAIYMIATILVCIAALLLGRWRNLGRLVAFGGIAALVLVAAREAEHLQMPSPAPPCSDVDAVPVHYRSTNECKNCPCSRFDGMPVEMPVEITPAVPVAPAAPGDVGEWIQAEAVKHGT